MSRRGVRGALLPQRNCLNTERWELGLDQVSIWNHSIFVITHDEFLKRFRDHGVKASAQRIAIAASLGDHDAYEAMVIKGGRKRRKR